MTDNCNTEERAKEVFVKREGNCTCAWSKSYCVSGAEVVDRNRLVISSVVDQNVVEIRTVTT